MTIRDGTILAVVVSLLTSSLVLATTPAPPAVRLKLIQDDVSAAERAFRDAQSRDDAEADRLMEAYTKKQRAGWSDALQIAKADPQSEVAADALTWILSDPDSCKPLDLLTLVTSPPGVTAIKLMLEHHVTSPRIGRAIAMTGYMPPPLAGKAEAIKLLEAVAERNPSRDVRGQAILGLAWRDRREFSAAEYRNDSKAMERTASVAQASFEWVIQEYGDCPNLRSIDGVAPRTATLAEEAHAELFELKYLRIGLPAPEIVAKDPKGTEFKLSDYRGKVVLLVFWASWCGPCMADVPHEKELVKRFEGKPFALIGVNGDLALDIAAKVEKDYQIPWRSFWNGAKDDPRSIDKAWNVRMWPTTYIIDAQGIICHKNLRGGQLDEPLKKLIAEAEAQPIGR